jgi:hypothetical protein
MPLITTRLTLEVQDCQTKKSMIGVSIKSMWSLTQELYREKYDEK